MFQRLKRLFKWRGGWVPGGRVTLGEPALTLPPREFRKPVEPPSPGARPPGAAAPAAPSKPAAPEPTVPSTGGEAARINLRQILLKLPEPLKARVKQPPAGGVQISLPLQQLIPQLARGSVRISFGELRKAAPPGIFLDTSDQDHIPVDLPLNEILAQVRPELLPRRAGQKKVEVPDEVTPIFGGRGAPMTGVKLSRPPGKAEPARPAQAAPAQAPAPAVLPKPAPPLPKPAPAARITPSAPPPPPGAVKPSAPPAAAPTHQPIHPTAPLSPPAAPRPVAPTAAAAGAAAEFISVPLASVKAGWPEAIRQALAGLNAPDAVVLLPAAETEQGLKKGKVVFQWKRIRSFIKPPLKSTLPPAVEESQVEFPLPVIAPIFLSQKKPATVAQRKYAIDADIPDVFASRGLATAAKAAAPTAPAAPAAPARAPVPAAVPRPPAPVAPPPPPRAPVPAPAPAPAAPVAAPAAAAGPVPQEIGELFGQPGRKNWSPAEVVQKTSGLRGVAGAIMAMQDGLLVASHLPPGLNGEAIAAFLPQMFGRMMQYSKELKFGESNHLTVIINDVPLKIYKLGGVFFAAVGRAEEPLPDAHLNLVAAHLSPSSK